MRKIGYRQLFSILLLIKVFSFVCSSEPYSTERMAGIFISCTAQFIVVIPMLVLCSKPRVNLKDEMLFGKLGLVLYAVFFIIWGAVSFLDMWKVTESISFPVKNKLFAAFLLAVVCLYASRLGLRVLARSAVLVLGLLAIAVIIMAAGAYSKMDLLNLTRSEETGTIWSYAFQDFCRSGELAAIFVLLNFTQDNEKKGVYSFLTAKLVFIEFISFIGIGVTGNLMQTIKYPFFEIGTYTQPFSSQRSEAVYIILFTFLCAVNITAQIIISSVLIEEIFPKFRFNELVSISLMLILSVFLNLSGTNLSFIWGIMIIVLSVVIPAIMYVRRKINDKKLQPQN